MSVATKKHRRFKVGDWVSFPFGTSDMTAQVIEDRGPLGVNGRRIYGIRVFIDPEEPQYAELPEAALKAVPLPSKTAVMKYLTDGGLVSILSLNLGGGDSHPKVWLTYEPRGRVTYTTAAEQGLLGGAVVPFFAVLKGKVFAGDQQKVVEFLETFGLNAREAKEVLTAVGTAP